MVTTAGRCRSRTNLPVRDLRCSSTPVPHFLADTITSGPCMLQISLTETCPGPPRSFGKRSSPGRLLHPGPPIPCCPCPGSEMPGKSKPSQPLRDQGLPWHAGTHSMHSELSGRLYAVWSVSLLDLGCCVALATQASLMRIPGVPRSAWPRGLHALLGAPVAAACH